MEQTVVNTHWYGGIDKLPKDTVYVGRPTLRGNPYSSKNGLYTKEEVVALHRIDLYKNCIEDPQYFSTLKHDLLDKDLACWCVHKTHVIPCHADNYIHVFTTPFIDRDYTKSVLYYLIDDLRFVLKALSDKINNEINNDDWLHVFMSFSDARVDIRYELHMQVESQMDAYRRCHILAPCIIDLEYALRETTPEMMEFRFSHMLWLLQKPYTTELHPLGDEPISPRSIVTKLKKVKKT